VKGIGSSPRYSKSPSQIEKVNSEPRSDQINIPVGRGMPWVYSRQKTLYAWGRPTQEERASFRRKTRSRGVIGSQDTLNQKEKKEGFRSPPGEKLSGGEKTCNPLRRGGNGSRLGVAREWLDIEGSEDYGAMKNQARMAEESDSARTPKKAEIQGFWGGARKRGGGGLTIKQYR